MLAAVDARAKLRMGGVTAEAFPTASDVVERNLQRFVDRGVSFKATAGLHHPMRSQHRLHTCRFEQPQCNDARVSSICCARCGILCAGGSGEERAWRHEESRMRRRSVMGDDALGVRGKVMERAQIGGVREISS